MARRKPRKSIYIPPTNEIENRKQTLSSSSSPRSRQQRPGAPRPVREPSWKRKFRQFPLILLAFLAVTILFDQIAPSKGAKGSPMEARIAMDVIQAVLLACLFIPASYMLERSAYRRYQIRKGQSERKHEPTKTTSQ